MKTFKFLLSTFVLLFAFRFWGFVSYAYDAESGVFFGDSSTAINIDDLSENNWYYNFSYILVSISNGQVTGVDNNVINYVGISSTDLRCAILVNSKPVYLGSPQNTITSYYYSDGSSINSRYVTNQSAANAVWNQNNARNPMYVERECNIPVFWDRSAMNDWLLRGDLHDTCNVIGYGYEGDLPIDPSALGYLTEVKYFVDSAAYQYNPSDTPEYVSWGDKSTTGIDLSDSRYKVEFALEDNSSYYVNRSNDYVSQYGYDPLGNGGAWALELRNYVTGLIAPSGSNARAILQGRSINTNFNGRFISAGIVSASARQHKFSAVARYLNGLNNSDLEEGSFRNFLQGYSDNPTNGYIGRMAQNISQLGRVYSMSYNIFARIVDTTSGAYGNWLKIDRHNVPYWDGDSEEVLNGRITSTYGYRFSPSSYVGDTFNSYNMENPQEAKPNVSLDVGYWNPSLNIGVPIFVNFNYVNNNFDTGGDVNNYTYVNENGDEVSGASDLTGTLDMLGKLAYVWNWYKQLFGGLLPDWAVACIPVFGSMFVAVLVYKFGIGLLPW